MLRRQALILSELIRNLLQKESIAAEASGSIQKLFAKLEGANALTPGETRECALWLFEIGALTEAEYLLRCQVKKQSSESGLLHQKLFGSGVEEKFERAIEAFYAQFYVAPRAFQSPDNERIEYLSHVARTRPTQLTVTSGEVGQLLQSECLVHFTFIDFRMVEAEVELLHEIESDTPAGIGGRKGLIPALQFANLEYLLGTWRYRM